MSLRNLDYDAGFGVSKKDLKDFAVLSGMTGLFELGWGFYAKSIDFV